MRSLAALLAIAWLLACAGNLLPCTGKDACVVNGGAGSGADACCDEQATDRGRCPPSPECPCCPQLPPAAPVIELAHAGPTARLTPMTSETSLRLPSPDPREILHVPKLDASRV